MELVLYGSIAWRHPLGMAQVIDWASQYGGDAVDARGMSLDIYGDVPQRLAAFGYDMLGPRQIRHSARKDLRQRLEERGKRLVSLYCSSPVNLTGEVGNHGRELFREYLQLAADLGAEWVRAINNTLQGVRESVVTLEESYMRTVEGLRTVSATARELGIGILLENNENTVTPDADSLVRMKHDLQDVCRVGIAYDPVNAYFQGLNPEGGLDIIGSALSMLHLKNVRRHDNAAWNYIPRGDFSYEWTSLADGDLNWPQLLQHAADLDFDGPLVYEHLNPFKGMPSAYWDSLPEPAEAAQTEAIYLRGLLEKL